MTIFSKEGIDVAGIAKHYLNLGESLSQETGESMRLFKNNQFVAWNAMRQKGLSDCAGSSAKLHDNPVLQKRNVLRYAYAKAFGTGANRTHRLWASD